MPQVTSTGEALGIVLVIALIALAILWPLVVLTAHLVVAFAFFVLGLPMLLAILLFVVFPPALLVFLAGLALIQLGMGADRPEAANIKREPHEW